MTNLFENFSGLMKFGHSANKNKLGGIANLVSTYPPKLGGA